MRLPDPVASLYQLLYEQGARFEIISHPAEAGEMYTPEDGVRAGLGKLQEMGVTFILKSEAGCLAAVISGDRRLSYKKIKKAMGLKDVSLAKADLVLEQTGARIGTVPPINLGLTTLVDERLLAQQFVFAGCGVALYTLKIHPPDLVRITRANVFDFTEEKTAS